MLALIRGTDDVGGIDRKIRNRFSTGNRTNPNPKYAFHEVQSTICIDDMQVPFKMWKSPHAITVHWSDINRKIFQIKQLGVPAWTGHLDRTRTNPDGPLFDSQKIHQVFTVTACVRACRMPVLGLDSLANHSRASSLFPSTSLMSNLLCGSMTSVISI